MVELLVAISRVEGSTVIEIMTVMETSSTCCGSL